MDKNIQDDIKITKNAAKRVISILKGDGKEGHALRISVVGGGCSGMSYNLTFDEKEKIKQPR